MQSRIGDHATTLRHVALAHLELGLDQQNQHGAGCAHAHQGGHDQGERDERQIGHHHVDLASNDIDVHLAHVEALDDRHPLVCANAGMQLSVSHVERHHVRRSALQQTIGESAGRRSGVENTQPRHVDATFVERGVELLATTTDESRGWTFDDHRVGGIDLSRGLVGHRTVHQHPTGFDEFHRITSAGHQSSTNEIGVEPLATGHDESRSPRWMISGRRSGALLRRALLRHRLLHRGLLRHGLLRTRLLRARLRHR